MDQHSTLNSGISIDFGLVALHSSRIISIRVNMCYEIDAHVETPAGNS